MIDKTKTTIVNVIGFSRKTGGASIASERFSRLLKTSTNYNTKHYTQDNVSSAYKILRRLSYYVSKTERSKHSEKRSLNLFSMPALWDMQKLEGISHFHWINRDTLSVFQLHRVPKNSIFTLHDEWLYCSTEHTYPMHQDNQDYISGYSPTRKATTGLPWSYLIWKVKCKAFKDRSDLTFTVPSQWMLDRAKASIALRNNNIVLLPNPIDTDAFYPMTNEDRMAFRKKLDINENQLLIAAGNFLGPEDTLKGRDYCLGLLNDPDLKDLNIKFVFFGGSKNGTQTIGHHAVKFLGQLTSEEQLRQLYSASNILFFPSMVESFGQIPAEALACETPVVCFDTSGLTDFVIDGNTGYTGKCFSLNDLKMSLLKAINASDLDRQTLGRNGREKIKSICSNDVVQTKYLQILDRISNIT